MQVGHIPLVGTTGAISAFVWLLALAYLYTEMTADERSMGIFLVPLMVVLQTIPALGNSVAARPPRAREPLVRDPRLLAARRLREPGPGLRGERDLRAAVQGAQGQAPRRLLRAPAVAAGARRDEPPHRRNRVGVPDHRHRRGRHLGGPSSSPARSTRGCRRCRRSTRRSSRWCSAGSCTGSRSSRVPGSAGGGRRAAWVSTAGFAILLLNFVPIGYFGTDTHNFY